MKGIHYIFDLGSHHCLPTSAVYYISTAMVCKRDDSGAYNAYEDNS